MMRKNDSCETEKVEQRKPLSSGRNSKRGSSKKVIGI